MTRRAPSATPGARSARRGSRAARWTAALLALILQILAPVLADEAMASVLSDPLAGAAICSHAGQPTDRAGDPVRRGGQGERHGMPCQACQFCHVAPAVVRPAPDPVSPGAPSGAARFGEWRPAAARAPPAVAPRARSPPIS